MDPLELAAFVGHWSGLGAGPGAEAAHAALREAWAEPHRAYHTTAHLAACLSGLAEVEAGLDEPHAVAIALWYHDAVYDPTRSDNEAASAALAHAHLSAAGAPAEAKARVVALIDATRHDAVPADGDARALVDVDLGILGASAERYSRYEDEVRREYSWVPEAAFRAGRASILRGFLARPRIYATEAFARLEAPARANLAWAIARLAVT